MRLFFLIPLATGLLSSYISLNNKEDISYLFGVIATGSLILSLILAPWEIQLLILLIVIVNIRQFLLKNTNSSEKVDNSEINEIDSNSKKQALIPLSSSQLTFKKISSLLEKKSTPVNSSLENNDLETKPEENLNTVKYRGVEIKTQENSSSLETVENDEIVGKYRGQPIKSHTVAQDLKLKKKTEIKYRGVVIKSEE